MISSDLVDGGINNVTIGEVDNDWCAIIYRKRKRKERDGWKKKWLEKKVVGLLLGGDASWERWKKKKKRVEKEREDFLKTLDEKTKKGGVGNKIVCLTFGGWGCCDLLVIKFGLLDTIIN